jgi:hypothetical protein
MFPSSLETVEQLLEFDSFIGLNSICLPAFCLKTEGSFCKKRVPFIIILPDGGKSAEIQCHDLVKVKLRVNEVSCMMNHC